jgi:hypothetical protein
LKPQLAPSMVLAPVFYVPRGSWARTSPCALRRRQQPAWPPRPLCKKDISQNTKRNPFNRHVGGLVGLFPTDGYAHALGHWALVTVDPPQGADGALRNQSTHFWFGRSGGTHSPSPLLSFLTLSLSLHPLRTPSTSLTHHHLATADCQQLRPLPRRVALRRRALTLIWKPQPSPSPRPHSPPPPHLPRPPPPSPSRPSAAPPPSASPSELSASPSELSASPSELSASPSELLASPSELSASPSELSASPSELLASPSELLASPSELLASPSEL